MPGISGATTSPAAIVCLPPSGKRQHQVPLVVERLEAADQIAISHPHADGLADAGGAGEPVGADGGKVLALVPLGDTPQHLGAERCEQGRRRDVSARRGEIGRGKIRLCGMARAIDADADGDGARLVTALAFDQEAREFFAREQEIVRPLDGELRLDGGGELGDRVMNGERGHERQFRPMLGGRRVGQQQARKEIALLRDPGAAAAPAPGALAVPR